MQNSKTGENRWVATNAYGVISEVSDAVTVSLDPKPQSPGGLTTATGDTMATITWNVNSESDIQGYRIYRDEQKLKFLKVQHHNSLSLLSRPDLQQSGGKKYAEAHCHSWLQPGCAFISEIYLGLSPIKSNNYCQVNI